MLKFLIKIIDKFYSYQKKASFKQDGNLKNVLLSYVLIPKYFIPFYYKNSHNNKLQCYLLVNYLKLKGYNVYLYDYLNSEIDLTIDYDLFIGHNVTFTPICHKLKNKNIVKILLGTGSEPSFGNNQQLKRVADLWDRKKIRINTYDDNIVPDLKEAYALADKIFLLGNNFVKNTYGPQLANKISLANNVTLHPYASVRSKFLYGISSRTNNFLFISSVGQIHRGLDLLLDVFAKTPDRKLYVLSAFNEEKDFLEHYGDVLFNAKNIVPLGFLNLTPKLINKVISDVDFVVLPSCSEGQSSSIINMMAYGLIPVATANVGLPNVEEYGILIDSPDLESVEAAIESAVSLNSKDLLNKREKLAEKMQLFGQGQFFNSISALNI